MYCYLCLAEQLSLNAAGVCVECSQGACAKPSSRRDHVFHGDKCACGCRKFVCEADMDDHRGVFTAVGSNVLPGVSDSRFYAGPGNCAELTPGTGPKGSQRGNRSPEPVPELRYARTEAVVGSSNRSANKILVFRAPARSVVSARRVLLRLIFPEHGGAGRLVGTADFG